MLPTPPNKRAGGVNSPLKAGSPDAKIANRLELVKPVRKRRIKKAGKKLDAEVKAIVWPELFKQPTVRITARERKAARLQKT